MFKSSHLFSYLNCLIKCLCVVYASKILQPKGTKDQMKENIISVFVTVFKVWRWLCYIAFLILLYPGLFLLFSSFSHHNSFTNWKTWGCCAKDSNRRPLNGRHRQIHWAMAALLQNFVGGVIRTLAHSVSALSPYLIQRLRSQPFVIIPLMK